MADPKVAAALCCCKETMWSTEAIMCALGFGLCGEFLLSPAAHYGCSVDLEMQN